ncbi:hypothetical protein SAURM35S_09932 [Streptomyces aurantiogriseus]
MPRSSRLQRRSQVVPPRDTVLALGVPVLRPVPLLEEVVEVAEGPPALLAVAVRVVGEVVVLVLGDEGAVEELRSRVRAVGKCFEVSGHRIPARVGAGAVEERVGAGAGPGTVPAVARELFLRLDQLVAVVDEEPVVVVAPPHQVGHDLTTEGETAVAAHRLVDQVDHAGFPLGHAGAVALRSRGERETEVLLQVVVLVGPLLAQFPGTVRVVDTGPEVEGPFRPQAGSEACREQFVVRVLLQDRVEPVELLGRQVLGILLRQLG